MQRIKGEHLFLLSIGLVAMSFVGWMAVDMLGRAAADTPQEVEHKARQPEADQCLYSDTPRVDAQTYRWITLEDVITPPKFKQWGVAVDRVDRAFWHQSDFLAGYIVRPENGLELPERQSEEGSYALWVYYCDGERWLYFGEFPLPEITEDQSMAKVNITLLRVREIGRTSSPDYWFPPRYLPWTRTWNAVLTRQIDWRYDPDSGLETGTPDNAQHGL